MRRKLIVLQGGMKECGAACLLSIIRYYNGDIAISRLVELTNTNKNGTNFYDIARAAKEIGLNARGYKIDDISFIDLLSIPVLVQLNINNFLHFVVIYEIKKDYLLLMDPANGIVKMPKEEFERKWTYNVMLFEPYQSLAVYESNKFILNILIDLIRKNKLVILNIVLLSLFYTIMMILNSHYLEFTIDYVINNSIFNLKFVTILFSVIALIKISSNFFRNYLLIYLNKKIDFSMLAQTYRKILLLPYKYFHNHPTGDIISRINDIGYIKNLFNKLIITVLLDILIIIIGGIILIRINKELFGIILASVILYLLIFLLFKKVSVKYTNIIQNNQAKLNTLLVEFINGYETIKGLSIEKIVYRKLDRQTLTNIENVSHFDRIINYEHFFKELVYIISLISIMYYGTLLINDGKLVLSTFITFNSLLIYFVDPIRNFIDLSKEYHYVLNSIKRIDNLFEIDTIDITTESNVNLMGKIEFKNLEFSFNDLFPILLNINLSISSGEKVLILGKTGSGKSTILKLIMKYYNVKRDMLYLDNLDINDLCNNTIRNNICYISQNETLLTDTIKNNIILERDIEEIEFLRVMKMLEIDEIVKNNMMGYNMMVEENGVNLSGGQRQRIILARALLGNKNIILIDEGLNQIDIDLERRIIKEMFKNYHKTIIIVSHRLNNMDLFDKVVRIDNGQVLIDVNRLGDNIV